MWGAPLFGRGQTILPWVTTGYFGIPPWFLCALIILWLTGAIRILLIPRDRAKILPALLPFALFGPIAGPLIFSIASPHPEIRYFFPFLLPLFAGAALGLQMLSAFAWLEAVAGVALVLVAMLTSFESQYLGFIATFAAGGLTFAALVWAAIVIRPKYPKAIASLCGLAIVILAMWGYVSWGAYVRGLTATQRIAWPQEYGALGDAWVSAADHLPDNAVVAYANTYLIYPLYGSHYHRHLVYVPIRRGVETFTDLPALGDHVPQDQIVPTVTAAMNQDVDPQAWLSRLHQAGVTDLFIAKNQLIDSPPELSLARQWPGQFQLEFENAAAAIYHVQ